MKYENKNILDNSLWLIMFTFLMCGSIFVLLNIYIIYNPHTYFFDDSKKEKVNLKFKSPNEIVNAYVQQEEEFNEEIEKFNENKEVLIDSLFHTKQVSDSISVINNLIEERYVNLANFYEERIRDLEKKLANCRYGN